MAITYPIQDSDRFTVYDTDAGEPLKDGRGRAMRGVKWGSTDNTQMVPNLAPNIKWLLDVKESTPAYDEWTQKLEKVTNYDVVNETATDTYNVVALTQEEQDAKVPAHYTTSGGIKLKIDDASQNAFANLLTLLNQSGAADTDTVTVKDVYGNINQMDFATFKTEIVAYGNYCYTQFLA
jgi:hypothetical protein